MAAPSSIHPFVLSFEKHELRPCYMPGPVLHTGVQQTEREAIRPLAQMNVYLQGGHVLRRKVPGRGHENRLQLVRGVWGQHPGGSDNQELRHE